MQHISEVEDARSKKSRKVSVPSKSCLVSIFRQVQDGFWAWSGKMVLGNNDFPQYVEIFRVSRRDQSGWAEIRQETYARIGYLPEELILCPS